MAHHTEFVLSTDADSIVPPDWAEKLVSALVKNPGAVAASGSSYIADGLRLTNWTMRAGMPFWSTIGEVDISILF